MTDLIRRQSVINLLTSKLNFTINHAANLLREIPSAPNEPAHWIMHDKQYSFNTKYGDYSYYCSRCKHDHLQPAARKAPFCPHCGARMNGGDQA